ncbi:hypothetical protein DUT90_10710 [Polaribacter sp. WD7]|uniref:class I SAM-dependent methyltransferase n=1 Tax=Polaribacter sp. WD7 TaxID=2269061 RepID=UPI000DF13F7C|nr:class I SAM-dependent methyltransferase [Polaribacter sp. WD7]RCS26235.1 hypothetical protein DUT90_10710 [Polaribacter sp. WD7]
MLKKLKSKIKEKLLLKNNQEDILAKLSMSSLLFKSYLPHSKSSLSYSSIRYLLNDIIINNRKRILEFGGGISTIYLAKLAQTSKTDLKIVTVDHDKVWIELLRNILKKEELLKYVELIYAPLSYNNFAIGNNKWYDADIIKKNIENQKFDSVLIDGPLAYQKHIQMSRYPALPFIINYLNENNSIILDDTNRKGERIIINLWEKKFNLNFIPLNPLTKISFSGTFFNIK